MDGSTTLADENQEVIDKHSSENFQKYIFELFEKNGVINDLRAYLRGHIVNVLKTSDSGETLVCQKNFTQRLELTFQAINILIAEYLLRLEFSYSLSVFVSEIPLANMVFSFARMLMETNDHSELRFKDPDVFSILKYIGIKCDSEHATLILDTYKNSEKTPLLLCILRCLPLYGKEGNEKEIVVSSSQDNSLSTKSSEEQLKQIQEKCTHHVVCKTCRNRIAKIKEKFKRKKESFASNINDSSVNSCSVDKFMKNISLMEKGLIDELFQQLKSVYETEMAMLKQDEDKRVQRSLAVHLLKLKQKKDQLESSYKAREAELQVALQEKKRFLWGLARTLREQHQHMARAMADVKAETERLASKEDSLRLQLLEAEKVLRQRGAEMRKQISSELSFLENHLESMKKERDSINRERLHLQNLKLPNANLKPLSESDDLRSHYDLLRDELNILKRYVQSAKLDPKCVIERGTMTDLSGMIDKFEVVLNNGQEIDLKDGRPRRLINDLTKLKTVNFDQISIDDQPNKGIDPDQGRSPGRSSASSEAGDAPDVELPSPYFTLQDENRRLRDFARQQRDHIDSLSWQQARLQAQISSQITPIVPLRTTATGSRPTNPQNNNLTPQNTVFNPQVGPFTSQSVSIGAHSSNFAPQTNFTQNRSIPNPFIFQSGSFAPHNAVQSTIVSQSALPQSNLVLPSAIGSQLLPTRPQPVANQGVVLPRPRTAPLNERIGSLAQRLHPTASVSNLGVGWRVGAGEELSIFSNAGPRIVVPGDSIPFVGVVGTRHTDNRRYLINQWRSLRRRISPLGTALKRCTSSTNRDKKSNTIQETTTSAASPDKGSSAVQPSCSRNDTKHIEGTCHENKVQEDSSSKRDKSPQTLLKEAKEKLKTNDQIKMPSTMNRDKSPNSVLREAKLRLKKLEIEAEAVEKSYLDFRKKREAMKEELKDNKVTKPDVKRIKTTDKLNETYTKASNEPPSPTTFDVDKYLSEFNTKLDLSKYKSKITTANRINPIPNEYSEKQDKKDYLETPLPEFRKYYNSGKRYEKDATKLIDKKDVSKSPRNEKTDNLLKSPKSPLFRRSVSPKSSPRSPIRRIDSPKSPIGTRKKIIRQVMNDKEKELEILKQNIGKIYNMSEHSIVEMSKSTNEVVNNESVVNEKAEIAEEIVDDITNLLINELENSKSEVIQDCSKETLAEKNLLRVDVENTIEANNVNLDSKTQDFTVLIESSVNDASEIKTPSPKHNISTQMTIIVGPKRSPVNIENKDETPMNAVQISEDIMQPVQNFNESKSEQSQEALRQVEDADYFDDFSADVDNYNSRSEFGNGLQSPISLARSSDEETFWDS